jgi:hypothetical protein
LMVVEHSRLLDPSHLMTRSTSIIHALLAVAHRYREE